MDNFMDRLAKRFSAGDIIKANAAAEERELRIAREQALEHEKLLQEIRRLNLKNVELSEQTGQLIQCGIEQFEEYDKAAEETARKNENTWKEYSQIVKEQISRAEEEQKAALATVDAAVKTLCDKLSESASAEKMVGEIRQFFTEFSQDVQKSVTAVTEGNAKIVESVKEGNAKIAECIAAENKHITEKLAIDQQKLVQTIMEELNKLRETATELNNLQETIKALEDYVHKENVKVYRNVQAVVLEQASQKTRELGDRLDRLEKSSKKGNSLQLLVVVTLLTAAASVVLQVLQLLSVL